MVKVGFTCGAFDLCHYGHIMMFEECKQYCDKLIVGIQTNPNIDREEKNKPVQSIEERIGQVKAIGAVDAIAVYSTEEELVELLKCLRPDIRFIGEDWKEKPYTGDFLDDIQIMFNSRKHKFSTSELINRIKKS